MMVRLNTSLIKTTIQTRIAGLLLNSRRLKQFRAIRVHNFEGEGINLDMITFLISVTVYTTATLGAIAAGSVVGHVVDRMRKKKDPTDEINILTTLN